MKMGTSLLFISFLFLPFCYGRPQQGLEQLLNYEFIHVDPDMYRNVSQLISSKGYPVENYDVQTEDGYVITIQRIPNGKENWNSHVKQTKDVVFLQHGLLSSSADWVMNFPNQSLGFLLADAGYDVWLGNVRGNTYGRRHVKYSTDSKEFWNFSIDEISLQDLPAIIDFILEKTGQKNLFYIGHSQGTLTPFALLSEKEEYNDKIRLLMALGPVATVGYITSPIRYLAPFSGDIEFLSKILGIKELLPSDTLMKYVSELVCGTDLKFVCKNVIFLLCGTDTSQMNETRLHVYSAHSPAGTSAKNIFHYAQLVNSKNFQKYDYGKDENLQHYNQTTPPEYKVENIRAPIALFWARNDLLADPTDVGLLETKLKTLVESYLVPLPVFNHLDFVYGINVVDILYEELFALMSKF